MLQLVLAGRTRYRGRDAMDYRQMHLSLPTIETAGLR